MGRRRQGDGEERGVVEGDGGGRRAAGVGEGDGGDVSVGQAAGAVRAAATAGRIRGLDSRRLVAMQRKRKGTRGGVEWLSDRLG
ncbi:unnamed protein product [Linum trigynum]|uniref:Uncharacterized protein n=1 Tax=Linum trigynum TaxID=586398 RepID=A0AAV2F7V8_9ROSI